MNAADLHELDRLLRSASAVVSMREVHASVRDPDVIGLRHDVDDNHGSFDTALRIAEWEHERGYRSTFFMLHTASYWTRDDFADTVGRIAAHGHEIGVHANAVAEALRHGGDPATILRQALDELRGRGFHVVGVAPHGDELCRDRHGHVRFVNDEMFAECARPEMGAPDRILEHDGHTVRLRPKPLAAYGLEYETYRLPRGRYLSDSGGAWNIQPADLADGPGQLHILWHPDWWQEAFA